MNDQAKIQTGDDLAQQALDEANQKTSPTTTVSPKMAEDVGEALTSLQNIIERNANELDRIKEDLKTQRDSLKNVFENDVELSDAEEKATVVTQQIKERKSKIQNSPQVMQLKTAIGELTEEKKEIEEALNNHLLNLYQLTGTNTFDTSSGEQREFSVRAALKSKKMKAA